MLVAKWLDSNEAYPATGAAKSLGGLKMTKPTTNHKPRRSKPVIQSKTIPRRHILIACECESTQRALFEHLRKLGVTCRILVL